jgi:hypothetical protein
MFSVIGSREFRPNSNTNVVLDCSRTASSGIQRGKISKEKALTICFKFFYYLLHGLPSSAFYTDVSIAVNPALRTVQSG